MSPRLVSTILQAVRAAWPMANDAEITLEANPTSIEADRFSGYRDAGINRVSIGIQALNDRDLRRLGRLHTANEARAAFDIARSIFDRVNFDLIYARQQQSLTQWQDELATALAMGSDHLSLYQLTVEKGTPFGKRLAVGKLPGLPNENLAADMYTLTQQMCEDAGMPAYEVSNHAISGSQSRHNLIYWRCEDYAGIGPGAHGRLTLEGLRYATETLENPKNWLISVETTGNGESLRSILPLYEQAEEFLMMGLRLREGISLQALQDDFQARINHGAVDMLVELGMLQPHSDRLQATRRGMCVLNAILREILTD